MVAHDIVEVFPFTSDDDAAAFLGIHNELRREKVSYRAENTPAAYRGKYESPELEIRHFLWRDNAGVSGVLITAVWIDGTNEHLLWCQFGVKRDQRRKGIGSALLGKAREVAKEGGRTLISFDSISTVPAGHAFAEAVGADIGIREAVNTVATADIDRSMLEEWRSAGAGRAPGYDILVWDDPYPEEFHEDIARLFVMGDEDMPFDDLDIEPSLWTAEMVADRLDKERDILEPTTAVARHTESGRLVGFSGIVVNNNDRATLYTTLTVVDREHRGFALGKWIKAAVILRAMDRTPEAVRLTTENAASNAPMLGINDAIGFKKEFELLSYQVSVEDVDAYLDRRGF